jgi:hypothetical protein
MLDELFFNNFPARHRDLIFHDPKSLKMILSS